MGHLPNNLPTFSQFDASLLNQDVDLFLTQARLQIKSLLDSPSFTWDQLMLPLEDMDVDLGKTWGLASHLYSVKNSPELREAYSEAQVKISEFYTELGQNSELYEAVKSLKDAPSFTSLSDGQQKVINNSLRSFKLSGISLENDKRKRFAEIAKELSSLGTKFSNNVLDATQNYHLQIDKEADLAGLPQNVIDAAATCAKEKDLTGWVFTLDFPSFQPLLTYGESREHREEIYRAYSTRASETGPNANKYDNTEVIESILSLRQEAANLLGFKNFSEKSIYTKMAESPKQVLSFIDQLIDRSRDQALGEVDAIKKYAASKGFQGELQVWDMGFYAEKMRQEFYDLNQEELRPYFTIDKVMNGLFDLASKLYDIQISEVKDKPDVWHDDVRVYTIEREGKTIASFYLDLYARADKRGGAWMNGCLSRHTNTEGELQLPVCYLVCNFMPPAAGKPGLLTHNEITTLFHEFGHGLHHMLTKVDIAAIAGVNGVAWDAVELPSQIMENWCWEKEVIHSLSKHVETGEALPDDKIQRLLDAKNFNSALAMMRQLEFACFDFRLHAESAEDNFAGTQELLNEVRKRTSALSAPEWNRFQNAFSHIFAGGYSAGYYSYKWAEVLSADAYDLFEEEGIYNSNTGKKFLQEILERGGEQDAADLFKNFRGREPKTDALLRHSGIK
ncbi:M3 family metallopeptidase [Lentisphaera profundi]|uniref:oligopeptidase A n=1 Tax=Lentisphaera profundi TaxID=1658616 RepID=A0ABY7VRL7_9BACT|nr:M3 family metallopeptidase [Lentisphaera profundi]WDE95873.1 M3 family metallopeptidase [Lentisphaera profundi]